MERNRLHGLNELECVIIVEMSHNVHINHIYYELNLQFFTVKLGMFRCSLRCCKVFFLNLLSHYFKAIHSVLTPLDQVFHNTMSFVGYMKLKTCTMNQR